MDCYYSKFYRFAIFVSMIIVISGCNLLKSFKNKSNWVDLNNYNELFIENFVIQNVEYRNFPERKSGLKINQDSILGIFLQNIEFIGLKVKLDSNASNQVGNHPIPYLYYFSKKKNRREYSGRLEVNKNKLILYPVIEFSNRFFLSQYGDITGHMLTISIFVFKDGKQVYCATNKQSNNSKPMHVFIDISKLYITPQQWESLIKELLIPLKNSMQ